jgi:hypothetical protein
MKKHEILEMIMNEITLIIEIELNEYLERIPEDIKYDIAKELRNKIQDKISEFNLDLDKT